MLRTSIFDSCNLTFNLELDLKIDLVTINLALKEALRSFGKKLKIEKCPQIALRPFWKKVEY